MLCQVVEIPIDASLRIDDNSLTTRGNNIRGMSKPRNKEAFNVHRHVQRLTEDCGAPNAKRQTPNAKRETRNPEPGTPTPTRFTIDRRTFRLHRNAETFP